MDDSGNEPLGEFLHEVIELAEQVVMAEDGTGEPSPARVAEVLAQALKRDPDQG